MENTSDPLNASLSAEDDFTIVLDGKVLGNVTEKNVTIIFHLFNLYPPSLLYFAGACSIIFMIFGIPANTISIVALAKAKRLRNVTTPLVINLCVIDLLFCCVNLPFVASNFLNRQWVLGDSLCNILPLIRYSSVGLNLFTVMSIAINRYVLIVHPNYFRKIFNKYMTIFIIVSIWVVTFLMLTPSLFGFWGRFGYGPQVGICTILPDRKGRSQKISLYVSAFAIPNLVFVYCYVRIYWVVRKSHMKVSRTEVKVLPPNVLGSIDSSIEERQQEGKKSVWMKCLKSSGDDGKSKVRRLSKKMNSNMRLVRTILVIFCTFILCYLPQAILKALKKEKEAPVWNILGYLGMYFPNCINPVIYVVMSKEYREAFKDLLNCYRSPISSKTDSTEDN